MPPVDTPFDILLRELAEAVREITRDESGRGLRLEGEPMRRVESLLRELLHCTRRRAADARAGPGGDRGAQGR